MQAIYHFIKMVSRNKQYIYIISGCLILFSVTILAQEEKNSCVICHQELGGKSSQIVVQWRNSVHYKTGIACVSCHGGNPKILDEDSMNTSDFIGKPQLLQILTICAQCHSDPAMMKKYKLRIDQLALYKTSYHGKALFERKDPNVATCVDCHGTHEIKGADEPLSTVYHTKVPETCSKCHSDKEMMSKYNLPANQLAEYEESYHGQILYGKIPGKNRALVPSCSDCHGSHGATPPGIEEVEDVCGNCHPLNYNYYQEGPHFEAMHNIGVPRCVDCHYNHLNVLPTLEMYGGDKAGHCGSCHEKSSSAYQLGIKIKDRINITKSNIDMIKKDIESVKSTGINIDELLNYLDEAESKVIEVGPITHTLDLTKIFSPLEEAEEKMQLIKGRISDINIEIESRGKIYKYLITLLLVIIGLLYLKIRSFR